MTALFLTPAARKTHRAAAHHLLPVVTIGNDGLSGAVLKESDAARSRQRFRLNSFQANQWMAASCSASVCTRAIFRGS